MKESEKAEKAVNEYEENKKENCMVPQKKQ